MVLCSEMLLSRWYDISNDDNDIDHIHENVVHESLKSEGALVIPSGITTHSNEPYRFGMHLPFISTSYRTRCLHPRFILV